MNPIERTMVLLNDMAHMFDDLMAKPMEKVIGVLGHDFDTPVEDDWQPTVEDDQGEALEPEPKVVTALGVDERDRQWRSSVGTLWQYEHEGWRYRRPAEDGVWQATSPGFVPETSGPFTEVVEMPPLTWEGWAVPAILEVLAENMPIDGDNAGDWREDVAPLIAERIACDPQRALEALRNEKVNP